MANKLGQLWILAEPQREHVTVPRDHDGLPPAVFERLLGDDKVAGCNVVPASWKAGSHRQRLLLDADGSAWFQRERDNDLAVQVLPDVGHESLAVGIEPTNRQLLGQLGQFLRCRLVDVQVHELSGLGYEVGIGAFEPRAPWLLMLIEAERDQRPGIGGLLSSG